MALQVKPWANVFSNQGRRGPVFDLARNSGPPVSVE